MKRALNILGLGLLALACSLPLLTAGASAAALYYAMAKSVRRGRGSPWAEFFRSFRANFLTGLGLTVILALLLAVAYVSALYVVNRPLSGWVNAFYILTLTLSALCAGLTAALAFPALSRFRFRAAQLLNFSFRLALKFPLRTLLLLLLLAAAAACVYLLPWLLPLFPGALAYASTFLVEPMLRAFTPARGEFPPDTDTWYLE